MKKLYIIAVALGFLTAGCDEQVCYTINDNSSEPTKSFEVKAFKSDVFIKRDCSNHTCRTEFVFTRFGHREEYIGNLDIKEHACE